MIKRVLIGLAVAFAMLCGWAFYYLYAPGPTPPPAAVEALTINVGGRTRHYSFYTPAHLQPRASVLFALHPSQSSGEQMRRFVGNVLERIAERENVVIVYPDGYEGHFNDCRREASYSARTLDVDDIGFMRQIVQRLTVEKNIDPERVFALGYSNGGSFAMRLALEAPDLVKGIASIAANLPTRENMACKSSGMVSRLLVLVEGTEDPVNPYQGGPVTLFGFGNRGDVLSAQASAESFAGRLGLAGGDAKITARIAGMSARQQDWSGGDAHVRLVTIEGGGHTIPQAAYRFPRIVGGTFPSDDVLESIWKLFAGAH